MIKMESAHGWMRKNCNMQRVRNAVKNVDLDSLTRPENAKYGLYIFVGAVVIAYFIHAFVHRRKPNRSWLKLRSRSPDPEKSDDVGRFAEKNMKATDRKPGST